MICSAEVVNTWYPCGTEYWTPAVGCMLSDTASYTAGAGAGARTRCWKVSELPGRRRCWDAKTVSWSSSRRFIMNSYSWELRDLGIQSIWTLFQNFDDLSESILYQLSWIYHICWGTWVVFSYHQKVGVHSGLPLLTKLMSNMWLQVCFHWKLWESYPERIWNWCMLLQID